MERSIWRHGRRGVWPRRSLVLPPLSCKEIQYRINGSFNTCCAFLLKIRSTKFETNSNIKGSNVQNILNFCHSTFRFVSGFDIRISIFYAKIFLKYNRHPTHGKIDKYVYPPSAVPQSYCLFIYFKNSDVSVFMIPSILLILSKISSFSSSSDLTTNSVSIPVPPVV